ncbi:hypothetical protein [Sphingorhabdus sp.]|uniref:hypothetical protein n=1 Tax=Sphingorhabdus sp. TaxID=1902408 RepID=UPI002FD9EAEB
MRVDAIDDIVIDDGAARGRPEGATDMRSFDLRREVIQLLGRPMTETEAAAYVYLRDFGYANPFDLVAELPRFIERNEKGVTK